MCYWVGTKKVREEMNKRFKSSPDDEIAQLFYETFIAGKPDSFNEHYVAIGKSKPQLTGLIKQNGKLLFQSFEWTLLLNYTDFKTGTHTTRELLNSTCEKIFVQHKDQVYTQRVLVPIDGYFEYFHQGKETYPYYIYPNKGLFYVGGIWDRQKDEDTGELTNRLSMISTPPNPLTQKLHNNPKSPNGSRMLLLIPENKRLDFLNENLKKNELEKFFIPYPVDLMKAHPVMRFQRKENFQFLQSSKVTSPYSYPELVA